SGGDYQLTDSGGASDPSGNDPTDPGAKGGSEAAPPDATDPGAKGGSDAAPPARSAIVTTSSASEASGWFLGAAAFDADVPGAMTVLAAEDPGQAPQPRRVLHTEPELLAAYGESTLTDQSIRVSGGTVTVRGGGIPPGHTVWVAGHQVPVDAHGNFIAEEVLPTGAH